MEGRHYTITAVTVTTGKAEDALTHLRHSARALEEVKFKLDMRDESNFAQSHGDVHLDWGKNSLTGWENSTWEGLKARGNTAACVRR